MKRKHIILVFSALLLAAVLLVTQALAADYWICSGCGKRVSELVGDMCPYCGYERHVHDWLPATCVSPKTCQACGETEGEPDPANHTGGTEVRHQREATCEEAGYTGDTCCAACGQVLAQGREIPAAEHRWESIRVIREATCIEQGLQERVCTVCGRTEERVLPVDPAMHAGATELRDSRPATCGAAGYTGDTYCLDCGKRVIRGRELPTTGRHDWQAATCTAPKTCRVCGMIDGAPAGHQWDEGRVIHPATCQVEGVIRYTCAACGETRTEILPLDPIAHRWDDGSVLYPATCTEEGMVRYTCTVCGVTEARILPPDPERHAGGQEVRNAQAASCEEAGYTGDVYCTACGAKLKNGETIIAAGHKWQPASIIAPKTCRLCGKTEGEPQRVVTFGRYEQDNNKANGPEVIEWRVLDVDATNGKVLIISKYGLDTKPYNDSSTDITWEKSTLRRWLNEDFVNIAFSSSEQQAIVKTNVNNNKNQGYSGWKTNGGNNTQDRIFLLSYAEANKYFGVQHWNVDGAGENMNSRAAPTAYAKNKGASISDSKMTAEGTAAGLWWLRSPGGEQIYAADVGPGGNLSHHSVIFGNFCVRPALWVNLESGFFGS